MRDISLNSSSGKVHIPFYPIDEIANNERAKAFQTRSIKTQSKLDALYLAIKMVDLTTLEGMDTPGKVRQLCAKASKPVPEHFLHELKKSSNLVVPDVPSVAAVCVYPTMVKTAAQALKGTGINIASVATAFPSGQLDLKMRLNEVRKCVRDGATEIDMVISRGDFLSGKYQRVFDEIRAVKEACGKAHLKVILETGELKTYDNVRLASWMSMEAGADFIKTSTGKVSPAATMPVTLVMLQAIQDYYDQTGKMIGMKPAGGIRKAKQAIHYLVMVNETLGAKWLDPDWFRFGASSLLNDLLKQIFKQVSSRYYYDDIFSLD